jgi:hypothetical protein
MMDELMVEWLREVLYRRSGALLKKKRRAGFRCFQGPLDRESENCIF